MWKGEPQVKQHEFKMESASENDASLYVLQFFKGKGVRAYPLLLDEKEEEIRYYTENLTFHKSEKQLREQEESWGENNF